MLKPITPVLQQGIDLNFFLPNHDGFPFVAVPTGQTELKLNEKVFLDHTLKGLEYSIDRHLNPTDASQVFDSAKAIAKIRRAHQLPDSFNSNNWDLYQSVFSNKGQRAGQVLLTEFRDVRSDLINTLLNYGNKAFVFSTGYLFQPLQESLNQIVSMNQILEFGTRQIKSERVRNPRRILQIKK